ncbi:hypothetical protein HDU84_009187 [Entophlyctis sp. JEL0112]|nr:hypothetical protein HDU84_009187 [Entophlyctis sp. JEL0112]
MGCSSGKLKAPGDFDIAGTALNYLMGGSPAVVGNLWDVTDRDIDRFSRKVLTDLNILDSQDFAESSEVRLGSSQLVGEGCLDRRFFRLDVNHSGSEYSLCEAIGRARDICSLPFMVGAAPVVYGVPPSKSAVKVSKGAPMGLILPLDVLVEIITIAIPRASIAEFARLTSVSRAVRSAMWSSPAARARVLINTFGCNDVLESLVLKKRGGADAVKWVESCASFGCISSRSLIGCLIRMGASFSANDSAALRAACGRGGCFEMVAAILSASGESKARVITAKDNEAFRDACHNGHLATAKLLLENGADIHSRADEALRFACCFGNLEMVTFLMENGANVNCCHGAALFSAVEMGHEDIALTLLAAGANPNATMYGIAGGKSPLQEAVRMGSLSLVEALIRFGADILYENSAAKKDAIRRHHWDVVQVLEAAESL